jgi:two-component system, OmpR family, response regulator RpaA
MPIDKEVLTTGEVAKICNVAPRTVSKWFDVGSLKGYRIPGSKDRRIPVAELVKFMKAHSIPMDGLNTGRTRVLIVDSDADVLGTLESVLGEQTEYEIQTASSGFEAGLACERFRPHVLLVDLHLDDSDARIVARLVQKTESLQMTRVIGMSGKLTDGQAHAIRGDGFDGFLKKPFQVRQVVESIESATAVAY